ncbi:efflux RND transporter periplasmic adaptor subunit [Pseudaeromonas sp. ZJS20]|uniref:efflux RND transporter periplasmic adaptor subunit n=1 Tax=Pseudaeromonas aegiceratis TaxID=3153928 RepID=UPI00390C49FF
MKKWMAIMLVIALLIFGSVIGYNIITIKGKMDEMASRPAPTFPVTALQVKGTDWRPLIDAIGFIEPNQGVTLSNQSDGKVVGIRFESGQQVKAGQKLIELDTAVERANLKAAQGRMPATKANLERMRSLYSKGSVAKGNLDDAEAEFLALSGQIEALQATIDRLTIAAPFAGQVGIRNVYLGEYLKSGTDIVRLEDTSLMKIRFTIPQTDISKVNVGQSLNIFVDAYPNQPFEGQISAIEPAVNAQSGVVEVQAAIPNTHNLLRSGMFAKVQVLLPVLTEQVVLPQNAINFTLYGETVFVLEDGKTAQGEPVKIAKQVVVKVGERAGNDAHVISGLKPGDLVVTSGQIRLSNGSQAKLVEDKTLDVPATTPML